MRRARLILALIWVGVLWGIIGGILKIVTVETSDWFIKLIACIGALTMWGYFCLEDLKQELS